MVMKLKILSMLAQTYASRIQMI